ncbi:MAG: hypothetical protein K2X65_10430, partial [Burkholderiaceae bacterium]|nr:hypothetical protein [Burkholderiaceae bacterium]
MAFELNLGSVRAAAQNTLATPWLMANVANVANLAKESAQDQPKPPKTLAKLATLAISQQRLTTFSAPTDVGAAQAQIEPTKPQKVPAPWCDVGVVATPATSIDQAKKPQPVPAK